MGGYNLRARKRCMDSCERVAGAATSRLNLFKSLSQPAINPGHRLVELRDPARQATVDKMEGAEPLLLLGGDEHLEQWSNRIACELRLKLGQFLE